MKMPKVKISTNRIMSITAFMISIGTLFTFIYQTRLMQTHQRASALPYLEVWCKIYDNKFEVIVYNNGLGPAFIKSSSILSNDSTYIFQYGQFMNTMDDSLAITSSNLTPGKVIPPGKHQLLLGAYNKKQIEKVRELFFNTRFCIQYTSVFNEKWEITGVGKPPVKLE